MKNFDSILESAIDLIPQQSVRYIAYSLLTIVIVNLSRILGEEI